MGTDVSIGELRIGNRLPLAVIGGVNVLESRELALEVADVFVKAAAELQLPYIFKGSFDKANRSSIQSFRGPGLERGLQWLDEIAQRYRVPVLTDVHDPRQATAAAEVCQILQLPAFLCRQTDLVEAIAKTGAVVNIKKAQFLSAPEVRQVLTKFEQAGNSRLMVCERGNSFGYNNLVVDMLNLGLLSETGYPVVFDLPHALQQPGSLGTATGGRRTASPLLMRSAVAAGLAALFVEAHPDPDKALCDGPCVLPLSAVPQLLSQAHELDALVKSLSPVQMV